MLNDSVLLERECVFKTDVSREMTEGEREEREESRRERERRERRAGER